MWTRRQTSGRRGLGVSAAAALAIAGLAAAAHGQVAPAPAAPPPAGPVAPAAPVTPPAVSDLMGMLDRKEYPAAAKAASKLLAQRPDGPNGYSRFQVTMLKGDALAGTRAMGLARGVYQTAQRETRDPHERALAYWTVELFAKAKGTNYVPRMTAANNGGPIDLVDRDSRKVAFAALLDDEMSRLAPDLKRANRSTALPDIFPAVQRVQMLTELDEVANGSDAKTSAVSGALLERARTLMSTALKGMWTRISDIHASATQQVTSSVGATYANGQPFNQTVTSQNGLTTQDRQELQGMIDTCGKIREAAETFMPLSNGGADKDWGAILNDATRVAGRASDVLQGNYSGTTVDNSGAYGTNGYAPGGYGGGYGGGGYYGPAGGGYTGPGTGPTPVNGGGKPAGSGQTTTPPTGTGGTGTGGTGTGGGTTPTPTPPSTPAPQPPRTTNPPPPRPPGNRRPANPAGGWSNPNGDPKSGKGN